ncbi:hypothetical protein SAMN04489832_5812 [Micromonospora cremea]|uniref:Uncharacterized protein n=1 Tax=Micromonospora cremea TaxID=709881 RepID=A0A1N6ANB1_9ACTN|nr:hypothetical protein SAMN04489832_5812 [Micromonospora cremea]
MLNQGGVNVLEPLGEIVGDQVLVDAAAKIGHPGKLTG